MIDSPLKNFKTNTAIRVVLLGVTVVAGFAVFYWSASWLAAGLIGVAAFYQLYRLVYYVEKTNRDLTRLLEAIRYSDFTQGFTSGQRGGSFVELSGALRGVADDFKTARREKEESIRYLETVMKHVGVGLITFSRAGDVNLINSAAKKLLRIPYLKHIDKLTEVSPRLVDVLRRLRNGDKTLIHLTRDGDPLDLSIYVTEFKMGGELYKLVSLQNIRTELENTEIEAWQKLTRVLSHEIMNSVAPIASLATTVDGILSTVEATSGSSEDLEDVKGAVATIARRSEGLLGFVESYRSVTRVPDPEVGHFAVRDLFAQVETLMRPPLDAAGIMLDTAVNPESMTLNADQEQIEQVLINLVKNAAEALENGGGTTEHFRPTIRLLARVDERGRSLIEVSDNGPGIPDEIREKMFVPFYTTKRGGSGIGLSLSREILRRHGGSLTLDDRAETMFVLRLT